ncbi:MAG: hypothetical protein EBU93_01760 [Chlamydiae bacterium]|nr:hypothetical protein [Chlamydiota bacterium]
MTSIWQILTHTTWWVFALFFYLLKIGIDATKPRIVSIKKLFILPIVFFAISINSLLSFFPLTLLPLLTYAIALTVGTAVGWRLVRKLKLGFDHIHHLVKVPGSFATLILILSIFSAKYYYGYSLATNPELVQRTGFVIFQLSLSGICTGLFLERLACYLFRKSRSSHENLKEVITA